MDFIFNGYSLLLLFFGSLTIILAIYIANRGGSTVRLFAYMMWANSIWSICYGLELASTTLNQIVFFINIEYLGIATLPLFWFLFCLSFCGKDCWYSKPKNLFLLLVFPILTLAVVWTNPWHHLHYEEILLNTSYAFPIAELRTGIWYDIFTVYFYLMLAAGCYLLISKFSSSDPIYRKQNYSILIAAIIPWLANMLYLLGIRPMGFIDLTPFAFIITTFLILTGIYRFKLFDIIPIAREKALELMQDGFLVLDSQHRIIDFNKAILKYIDNKGARNLIGLTFEEILPNEKGVVERIASKKEGKIALTIVINGHQCHLEAEIRFLSGNSINDEYTILKFQDFTATKQEALFSRKQADELQKLNQLKDRIFSIIAHDLRGPLVNLSEVLKLISDKQISMTEFDKLAPELSKDIVYTTDLVENILHWSRSQLKGFGINKEYFNVRNIITNEINYHQAAAKLKSINITHDVFPNQIGYADSLMFQIVMRNLLNNAIKFCREGGEILITAGYQKNQMLQICIIDNGIGIPADILAKLFKDENITTRGTSNEKGTGLGLLVCKDFMQRNDGDITVESTLDKGSKFCVSLPIGK